MKQKANAKKSKFPKPENTEALEKVKQVKSKIEAYYKKNKLDPEKDYSKDKKHGPIINEWMKVLEVNRSKLKDVTPTEIHHKKSEDKLKKPKAEKAKELPKDSRKVTKYDYPLVDGKEMTSEEKRKYRAQMRKKSKDDTKATKKSEKETKVAKEVTKKKTEKSSDKKSDKKDKKKKKKVND